MAQEFDSRGDVLNWYVDPCHMDVYIHMMSGRTLEVTMRTFTECYFVKAWTSQWHNTS